LVIDDGAHTSVTTVMVGVAAVTAILAEPEMFKNPATLELAVQVAVPTPDGVKTPPDVIVPPVAVQVTVVGKTPVPNTVAAHVDVCPVVMDAGEAEAVIPVMVNGAEVTVMFAEPEMFVYPAWAELAVHVAVPAPDGVKTPAGVIVPPVAVHVTAEL
jgi:hypothetical protein